MWRSVVDKGRHSIFREVSPGLYDFWVDGRIVNYDVEAWEFQSLLRRARVTADNAEIEDATGHRVKVSLR